MYWGQEPLGKFVLGDRNPYKRVSVTPPVPTEGEIIERGGCTLARVFLLVEGRQTRQLKVLSGAVTVSSSTDVRRVLEAELLLPEAMTAAEVKEMLDPTLRIELRAEIGYRGFFGGEQWFSMGVFEMSSASVDVGETGRVASVHCPDRVPQVKRAKMLAALRVPKDQLLTDTLALIFADRCGEWLPLHFGYSFPYYQGRNVILGGVGEDPWDVAQKLCEASGSQLIMNRHGAVEHRTILPVWREDIAAKWDVSDPGLISALSQEVDMSGVADGVIMRWGTGAKDWTAFPDASRRSYIVYSGDTTMFSGPSPMTDPQLGIGAIANAELLKAARGVETVSGKVMADPRLDAGDVVQIRKRDIGFEVIGRLEKLVYTFGSSEMSFEIGERLTRE